MKNTNYIKRIIGIAGLLISIILVIYFSEIVLFLIALGEKYFSPDNYLEPEAVFRIKTLIAILILLTTTVSIFFILNLVVKIHTFFNHLFQTNNAIKFFSTDNICNKKRFSLYILVIGTMLGFLIHIYLLLVGHPSPEAALEKYSSLLFLFSVIILIISTTRIDRELFSSGTRKRIIFLLIMIAGIFSFIFGEELSWGQRIFGYESFGIFSQYSFQNETTIHNFANPIFIYIYPLAGMSLFTVLFFIWFFPKKKKTYLFNLFCPHPSLFFLALIMAGSSFNGHSEIFEALLAIFVFLYSLRIFMCLSFPKTDLYSQ